MRETVDPEFAAYVDAREGRWFRSAYLVYGEPERAEEHLLHAFTRLALRWGKEDDPDAFVQRLLYQPALSRRSRPKLFQDDDQDEDEQPVKAALAGLSPAQRTVLVLLYFDELTEFEVADVLGMSHAAVHGHAQTALSAFRSGLGHGDWRNAEDRR